MSSFGSLEKANFFKGLQQVGIATVMVVGTWLGGAVDSCRLIMLAVSLAPLYTRGCKREHCKGYLEYVANIADGFELPLKHAIFTPKSGRLSLLTGKDYPEWCCHNGFEAGQRCLAGYFVIITDSDWYWLPVCLWSHLCASYWQQAKLNLGR